MLSSPRSDTRRLIDEVTSKQVLARRGITVPAGVVVDGHEIDLGALRPPFVAKVIAGGVDHKSDVGGVRVGLRDLGDVRSALGELAASVRAHGVACERFLVEEQATPGWELAVGGFVDPQFGPMIMLGLGGVLVELVADVTFRLAPITADDAAAMIAETTIARLARGFRGRPPLHVDALVEVLVAIGGAEGLLLSGDAALGGAVVEIDVNPLIVDARGAVAVDAGITTDSSRRPAAAAAVTGPGDFRALLTPGSVAIVGISASGDGHGANFLRALRAFGFAGRIYPVHPRAAEIDGLTAYRSLADIPEIVDYAYIVLAAASVPAVLDAAAGNVRFAQVVSSGFGETPDGADLEKRLVATARRGDIRVLGPNCLGTHSPAGRLTFVEGASPETGSVAVVSQSGGLTVDVIRWSAARGVRLQAAVSVGNSADITPVELVDHFLADPDTRVIGLYLEDASDGRRLFDRLRQPGVKPVVILTGGTTAAGGAAAASHTGALVGEARAWAALSAQTGAVIVDDLDSFVDALAAFQDLDLRPHRPTGDVVVLGNGGGTSVLAADSIERVGLSLISFDGRTAEGLAALELPPGTSVANPIDTPIGTLAAGDGEVARRILDVVLTTERPGAVVMHLDLPVLATMVRSGVALMDAAVDALLGAAASSRAHTHCVLVLRSDGSPSIDEHARRLRGRAAACRVPVYPDVASAAAALAAVAVHERRLGRSAVGTPPASTAERAGTPT